MSNYKKILVLGAGPVKIGQSLEFDYSALQVCRALKEEGITVIFANSSPSALSTDKTYADKVYIEPLNIESVKRILEKEKPDALLSTAGGDDSLELSLELAQNGYLDETNTVLIGINQDVIRNVKNRHSFVDALSDMGEPTVPALVVNGVEEACDFADKVGYPVIVRPAYTPDRESAEYCNNRESLWVKAEKSLETSIVSQILIEKSIAGWKEIEFEVIRDSENNCISVSSVESVDPVGIHTGDSIVVIPAQTLTDSEFTRLRRAARKIVSNLGIEGSCNVQFALSPDGKEYVVTGVDPRVSRTSALVSKATGYRIAYVSAKIALGKVLFEIENDVTGCTTACNEPAMDYCAVKFPKWSFESFSEANRTLGTMMKATGESLTIGTGFELAFMKGVRGANKNHLPHLEQFENVADEEYTLAETENAEGTTDTETKAASKEYVGFTANEIKQEYIEGDGSTIVKIYYDRNEYTVTYKVDGETEKVETYRFEEPISQREMLEKEGYKFSGWSELPETMPAENLEATGTFTIDEENSVNLS